jgi:hypothetical protein
MLTGGKSFNRNRLVDLERTVNFLNGQLREIQWSLYRAKVEPLPARLWRSLVRFKGDQEFMSAYCNRSVRPNTKRVSYADRAA